MGAGGGIRMIFRQFSAKKRLSNPLNNIFVIVFICLFISFWLSHLTLPAESFWGRKYLPFYEQTLLTFVCDEEIETKYVRKGKWNSAFVLCGKPDNFVEAQFPHKSEKQIYFRYCIFVTLYLTVFLSIIFLILYGLFCVYKGIKFISP
jgi:hypothetical protein